MGSFTEARKEQLSKWMGGPEGEGLAAVFGDRQDAMLAELKAAVRARFPNLAGANDTVDALSHLGAERRIWRFPTEDMVRGFPSVYITPAQTFYAERLHMAPLLWYWAGTKSAMYNVFAPVDDTYTPPTETWRMVEVNGVLAMVNRHEPSTSTKLFVFNNVEGPVYDEGHYSAFCMVYDARNGEWEKGPVWDEFIWDEGWLYGSTMTVAEAQYLLFQILTWKAVISYPVRVALWMDPDVTFWGCSAWDEGWLWAEDPTDDTFYLTLGHSFSEQYGDGGWINDAEPHTNDTWDGGWLWPTLVNPVLPFGDI